MFVSKIEDKEYYDKKEMLEVLSSVMGYMLGELRKDVYKKGIYLSTLSKFESLNYSELDTDVHTSTRVVNYIIDMFSMIGILGEEEETSMVNILMDEIYDMLNCESMSVGVVNEKDLVGVLNIFELV